MMPSPCTGACLLDPRTGLCRGCGRSGDEISAWPYLPEAAQRALLSALPARMASRPPFKPVRRP
ncbi:DUF1289 domain-containing protein [Falsiroseomonas sp. E2-1-a20]|uniref:DUF1289 domain-containing protein n=1 Tax=Falsiroseomonas sp. E2-1-a20 TaxID=3239300 RepID=UPI003F3A434E